MTGFNFQHIGGAGHGYDDTTYDWSDCSITHVTQVLKNGKPVNGQRYQDTKLASEAYLASGLYEINH